MSHSAGSRRTLQRDTRSCYECEPAPNNLRILTKSRSGRSRKIKCVRSVESGPLCAQCAKHGRHCAIESPSPGSGPPISQGPSIALDGSVEERLDRMEQMLRMLVQSQESTSLAGGFPVAPYQYPDTSRMDVDTPIQSHNVRLSFRIITNFKVLSDQFRSKRQQ
jgi:hypothetical protein